MYLKGERDIEGESENRIKSKQLVNLGKVSRSSLYYSYNFFCKFEIISKYNKKLLTKASAKNLFFKRVITDELL